MADTLDARGAKDTLTTDVITLLKADSDLSSWTYYSSERLVNLDKEDDDLNPYTPLPFITVQLGESTKDDIKHTGGFYRNRKVKCTARAWFSPTTRDEDLPSLNKMGEIFDDILQAADDTGGFNSYVNEYEFITNYPGQYGIVANTTYNLLAYTSTLECFLYYNVI